MIKFESDNKFSEVITKEDIAKWEGNIIFEGGTATGKTHFVLNTLQEYCFEKGKNILFLCNRTALAEEVRADIEGKGIFNIEVDTYQNVEEFIRLDSLVEKKFDYLICDEFHHMLEVYNIYTDLSLKWIIRHPARKIFMSATCSGLFNLLIESGKVNPNNHYYIPKSYNYVDEFIFYNRKDAYLDIIKDIMENTNDKIIYFTQSLEQAIELYEKYKDNATFFCSKWTKNPTAQRLLKENEGRIHSKTFEGRLLIATTALDVGITLKGYDIKHIICNIYDYSQMIQCLGRKRVIDKSDKDNYIEGKEDRCTFYIRNYTKRQLNMYRNTKLLKEMKLFKNDREKFDETYLIDREWHNKYIPYNTDKKDFELNYIAYLKLISNEGDLDYMTKTKWTNLVGINIEGVGYKWFILDKLGMSLNDERVKDYEMYEEKQKQDTLISYLESIIGKKLFKKERDELIEKVGLRDKRNRLQKGISQLNSYFEENKILYKIQTETELKRKLDNGSNNPHFKKVYWIIGKITY